MANDPAVINTAYGVAKKQGVSDKVLLALFEAGVVESDFQNLNYGMDDSTGYLQQRVSQGWKDPMNVTTATNAFLAQAIAAEKKNPGATAGQIAQAVQRSGVPLAYDQAQSQALALLKGVDPAAADAAAKLGSAVGTAAGDVLGLVTGSTLADGVAAVLAKIGAAADEFTTKAKIAEQIATGVTKLFLPNNLLRAAAGVLGAILLCFSLLFLGRELAS